MKRIKTHNSQLPFFQAKQLEYYSATYNLCFSYTLNTNEHVERVTESIQKLINLKPHLRQTFKIEDDELITYINDSLPAEIHRFKTTFNEIENLEQTLIQEQHDIETQSSIRLNIINVTDSSECILLFNIHHIIMDGISLDEFLNDLNNIISGEKVPNISTTTYIQSLNKEGRLKKSKDKQIQKFYCWADEIALDLDYPDIKNAGKIEHYKNTIPEETQLKLNSFCQEYGVSTFNTTLLAWSIFTAILHGKRQSLINYPVNVRENKQIGGCFVNNLVYPLEIDASDSFIIKINALKKQYPLLKKARKIMMPHHNNIGAIPSFAQSNFCKPNNLQINNDSFESRSYAQIANASLSIKYKNINNRLHFSCDIYSKLFPDYLKKTLLKRFFYFLNQLVSEPQNLILNTNLTFPEEVDLIKLEFNQPITPLNSHKTLIELFEDQVERTPKKTAIVFGDKKISYKSLNEKANQVAHYLTLKHQVKPNDLIALYLDRNESVIIAILAVLKTGGAYVPIDLNTPTERIGYILQDTDVNIVITNRSAGDKLYHLLDTTLISPIFIDSDSTIEHLSKQSVQNIINADTNSSLAYVIYTSGTTGIPKGVMVEHKSVINTLNALEKVYTKPDDFKEPLKITAFTSYAFDVSVSEFFMPLLRGNELHILCNKLRQDILLISKYINSNNINYIYLPPILLAAFPRIKYPSLLGIVYAGESCDKETTLYWSQKTKLYNYYGPTEATIYTTGMQLLNGESHLIGKPISNTKAYILNNEMNFQPIGVPGELYIGGLGLAKGYLNQPQLTSEKFIANPFQTTEEKEMGFNRLLYKTGDLARWTTSGYIEYLGRNDFQVKIRGYRIELGEIEATLKKHSEIKQAVVLVKNLDENGENNSSKQYLAGYYVSDNFINPKILNEFLSLHLPEYMRPKVLIHIAELPTTPNGKLNKELLPNPEITIGDAYIAPTNRREKIICSAFSNILLIKTISIDDDFFDLGGNSIMAISLVSALQDYFNIGVTEIFNLKTPRKIAKEVAIVKNNFLTHLEQITKVIEKTPLSVEYNTTFQKKISDYHRDVKDIVVSDNKLSISSVLLTGATGFLGCNLLEQLLTLTDYSIFLIVRANSDEHAFERINQKFNYYFERSLGSYLNTRVFIVSGDIEEPLLGLSDSKYNELKEQVDSIIHCAALTKHYGDYDVFYKANVQATINLLELARLTKLKQFNYISTLSVLDTESIPNCSQYVFTEEDSGDNIEERTNIYVKTKYEGETITTKYQKVGVKTNIYRVGNLAFMSDSLKGQENISDNAFFSRLNCLINMGWICPQISREAISPVDLTARAITLLFDKAFIQNKIHHVFNTKISNVGEAIYQSKLFNIQKVSVREFISNIVNFIDDPKYQHFIELYLLHKRWLDKNHNTTYIEILQNRTGAILKEYGFEWPEINPNDIATYLNKECSREENGKNS